MARTGDQPPRPDNDRNQWVRIRIDIKTVSIVSILLTLGWFAAKPFLEASFTRVAGTYTAKVAEYAHTFWDDRTCGGRIAETEGDRLAGLAEKELTAKDVARAQALFRDANTHYEKAYKCGFPDAGIRLAVAHCMGFGTPKNQLKARHYVLDIEDKHPTRTGRAADVRKLCGL